MAELTLERVLPGLEHLAPEAESPRQIAEREWHALVHLLTPRSVARVARRTRNGRWEYPGGRDVAAMEVPIDRFPQLPTAVYVYAPDGTGKVLVCDLDAKDHTPAQVAADAESLKDLFQRCRIRWIESISPSGGRHLYIVWSSPRQFDDLKRLSKALHKHARKPGWNRTFDKTPMSGIANGLIRTPGSPHKSGGFQALVTPLSAAVDIATRGNGPLAWELLHDALQVELTEVDGASARPEDVPLDMSAMPVPKVPLSPLMDEIARTGIYPTSRYPTDSEARIAVLVNAVACGWTLHELMAEAISGRYGGLNDFFARYPGTAAITVAWINDWQHAAAYVANKSGIDSPLAGLSITGGVGHSPHPRATAFRWVRSYLNAVCAAEEDGTLAQSERAVLRGLSSLAMCKGGQRILAIGIRGIDLGSCVDHTTVSGVLRGLRERPDPFLRLVEDGRGREADLYELLIPTRYADAARWRRWKAGRIEPLHHVFRDRALGVAAGLMYESLGPDALPPRELNRRARIPARTQREACLRLATFGLAEKDGTGWRRGPVALGAVARELGADDAHAARVERFRTERADWHAYLDRHQVFATLETLFAEPPPPEPPDEDEPAAPEDEPTAAAAPLAGEQSPPGPPWITCPADPDHPDYIAPPEPPDEDEQPPEPPPAEPDDGAAAQPPRPAKPTAGQLRWSALSPEVRCALEALFHADQLAEKEEGRRRGAGEYSSPAEQWRALRLDAKLAAAMTRGRTGDPRRCEELLAVLVAAGLVRMKIDQKVTGTTYRCWLEAKGRRAAREGLGVPPKPKRPEWAQLSPGYWRLLDQVAAAGPDGVAAERIWQDGAVYLGEGHRPRPGKGFIEESGGRWYLTEAGHEHHSGYAEDYRQLYGR